MPTHQHLLGFLELLRTYCARIVDDFIFEIQSFLNHECQLLHELLGGGSFPMSLRELAKEF